MRVLLPPSETKVSGGGSISFTGENLSHANQLGEARERVFLALEALCAGTDAADEDTAAKVLKLGVRARGEIAHNRVLLSSPTLPAIERYTGVLFDSLAADTLSPPARAWIDDHVSIQSALFGLIQAGDLIPAYRLSASSPLALGRSADEEGPGSQARPTRLKTTWRDAHADLLWSENPFIIDLRSKDYAALAPLPEDANFVVVEVAQRTIDGRTRALNHFNKQAKGDLVRRLATSRAEFLDTEGFIAWATENGLEIVHGNKPSELTLITELGAPTGG